METTILTRDNIRKMRDKLRELTNDKKYWINVANSRIESVEDPCHDWFRGVGTFERIVHLDIFENHYGHGLEVRHINAVDHTLVIPERNIISFSAEIIIDGNDVLYFVDGRPTSQLVYTGLYMEWTRKRNEKYHP